MSFDALRQPGQVVSFDTKPTTILPVHYTNVKTCGVVGYDVAITIDDVSARYQQLLPFLPDINKDFTKADYLIIKHNTGNLEVLALSWIEESTITSTSIVNRKIMLYGVQSTADEKIAKMLRLNGFPNYTIENA